jgi:hypothetical protein
MADSLATFELRQDAKPGGLCDPDEYPAGADLVPLLTRSVRGRNLLADALEELRQGCDLSQIDLWNDCVAEANRVRA